MISQTLNARLPRINSRNPSVVVSRNDSAGFDPQDALHSIREYRLRKVATKRIPSRIN